MTIRWGILSTGTIARHFTQDLKRMPDADVVAVGSRSREAADRFAAEFAIPRAYGTWRELADDPEVDVVYVATPHSGHHAATLTCIEGGKAVLTEKPFALDSAQSEEMVEAARTAGVFLMEAMWMRFFPSIHTIAGLVADGAIGEVTAVHADFGLTGEYPPTHRLRARELGGGALLDLGVYPVTFAQLFLGPPDEIQARAKLSPEGVDENTGMLFGYASGAMAALTCSLVGDSPRRAVVTGTRGRVEVHRDFFRPVAYTVWRGDQPEHVDAPVDGWGYHYEAAEVHRCLAAGRPESDVVPLAETLTVMATLDAVRERIGVSY
jgi:predicted dehydrogenase